MRIFTCYFLVLARFSLPLPVCWGRSLIMNSSMHTGLASSVCVAVRCCCEDVCAQCFFVHCCACQSFHAYWVMLMVNESNTVSELNWNALWNFIVGDRIRWSAAWLRESTDNFWYKFRFCFISLECCVGFVVSWPSCQLLACGYLPERIFEWVWQNKSNHSRQWRSMRPITCSETMVMPSCCES